MFGGNKKLEKARQDTAHAEGLLEASQQHNSVLTEQHERDTWTIQSQQETLASNRNTIDDLRQNFETHRAANDIARYALQELSRIIISGEVVVSAQDIAQKTVTEMLIKQATAEQVNQLIDAEERRQRSEFGPEQIAAIRTERDQTFKDDGTYSRKAEEVKIDVRTQVGKELIAARQAEERARLSTPDMQAQITTDVTERFERDGTLAAKTQEVTDAFYAQCEAAAITHVKDELIAKLEANKDAIIRRLGDEWLASDEGQDYYDQLLCAAREFWSEAGREAVAEKLGDTVTMAALHEINDKTKKEIQDQDVVDLLKDFGLTGLYIGKLPKNTRLTLYFGSFGKYQGTTIDGKLFAKSIKGLHCDRILELTSTGKEYVVNSDSVKLLGIGAKIQLSYVLLQNAKAKYQGENNTVYDFPFNLADIAVNGVAYERELEKFQ